MFYVEDARHILGIAFITYIQITVMKYLLYEELSAWIKWILVYIFFF